MALTDKQLEIISDALLPLFQYLEREVIVDVANRIKESLAYTRTAELKAESMQRLGYSPAKIRKEAMKLLNADADFRKAVAKNTLEHKREVKKLLRKIMKDALAQKDKVLKDAADMSYFDDLRIWKEGGKELTDNSFLPQLVEAMQKQTADTLKNLSGTTGFKTMSGFEAMEDLYRREMDKAMIKVCTGTYTQEKVIYDVVHSLADSGLRTIDFSSGYTMQLDTAVRLAMRTGAHQLSGKITDKNIEQTGENLVYVSKHWGARNTGTGHANHEQWQGKVYFIKDGQNYAQEAQRIGQERITSLWYATGYSMDGEHPSDPTGLYGYNCRHRHYAWFEGISGFPKDDPEPKPVTINGKTYDYYAMTQKMRSMERTVRALKRERDALNSLGVDTKEIQRKINSKVLEYKDFCTKCKVNPQINRLRYDSGTADLKKTKAWKELQSEIQEYRIIGYKGSVVSLGERMNLYKMVHTLPGKAQKAIEDVTFCLNSEIGGGYWHRYNKIYLPANVRTREFYHEVGHRLEAQIFDEEAVNDLKKKLVQGLTKDDIISMEAVDSAGNISSVFILDGPQFINEYQGRLYVASLNEALNPDGSINLDVMGEVVSVAVERYFTTPNSLKKNFPEMYKLVEDAIYE